MSWYTPAPKMYTALPVLFDKGVAWNLHVTSMDFRSALYASACLTLSSRAWFSFLNPKIRPVVQNYWKMFPCTITKMSEFIILHPSHFGCLKSAVLLMLKQMYINNSCPNLGIGIEISYTSINSVIIDPNEGCCLVRCTFLLHHIIPGLGTNLKKNSPMNLFMVFHLIAQKKRLQWGLKAKGSNIWDNMVSTPRSRQRTTH